MKRRDLLQKTAALSLLAAGPWSLGCARPGAIVAPSNASGKGNDKGSAARSSPLVPPATGSIPVAFLLSEGAVVIDFCGPWEVFQDVSVMGRADDAFHLYTVAETTRPIKASGGLKIVPDHDLATAPEPKVIVIPAQSARSEAVVEWIRASSRRTDLTMSVCTGAFLLAKTGLLSGKSATTHHGEYTTFAMDFPDIHVERGARFVEDGNLATSGGLSSGIDLALRVVERYFGRDVAQATATRMEYQGQGWLDANSNAPFAKQDVSTAEHPRCAVCGMDVDGASSMMSVYQGKTYFFCEQQHKNRFDAAPEGFSKKAP
jgi:transcriptional regulator GlxA family with amidase domain